MNKKRKSIKSTHFPFMKHITFLTPFLDLGGSLILTSSFSLLKIKIMKFMERKMLLDMLFGQEAVKTKWFLLQYLTYNIILRQNSLSYNCN